MLGLCALNRTTDGLLLRLLRRLAFSQNFRPKEEVSREFDVISKPKNVCLSIETRNCCLVLL